MFYLNFSAIGNGVPALTLCVLSLLVSGCSNWAGLTSGAGKMPPAPLMQGTLVTREWQYLHPETEQSVLVRGEWIHLPAAEAGDLLLWIESVEESCR